MNMNEFDSCVHRIIKRIYPVLAYEYEMGLTESRGEPSGIYSFQLLRSLHDNSLDNIHKILRQAESENDCKDKEFDKAEKKILLEFFTYLNEKKSQLTQSWLSLQHYMHYIYCSFTSGNPQLYDREISELYIAEMKNLVKILSEADKIQLYLRVFSILREYVTFAFWQYSKQIHKGVAIDRLHRSYQAFLIASNNIYPVFLDLEKILKDKCNMTWMDYNKFIFFNYFYEAIETEILMKIRLQEKLDVPEKYNSMIVDFGELNTLWQTLKNLRGINENMDKEMSDDHKQILKKVFWICRKETEEKQSLQRLAAELIILASERRLLGSEPLLDKHGQCLCEDCLIFKLSYIVEPGDGPDPNYIRVSPCRYCPEILELNKLHDHVVEHLKIIVANEDDDNSLNFMTLEKSIEVRSSKKNRDNREDCAEKMSQCLINLLKKNENLKEQDVESKPSNNRQDEKTIELVESKENIQKESVKLPLSSKNEVKYKNSSSCSHTCKHEEELKAELKKLHGVCDHHKDSKRCDCTYCEVFGTGVSTHIHKSSETRNRLRIRLNQRKQKILSKNAFSDKTNKVPPTVKNNPTAVKPKIEQSTTPSENELPKESTPEVKPVLKSSDSFIKDLKIISETTKDPKILPKPVEHDKLKDIPGLVDYIEGNSGTDKVAIAEKKAAKKARQRQKKEEERKQIEQEEKRNEIKDNDKETKNMKQLDKLTSNEVKNSKKQKNKETSNGDKLYDKTEKNKLIEETIPAMVTIKRSIENGNVKPTVTITLKGSTPDQDKLIYALVNGHDQNEEKNNQDKSKKNKKKQDSIDQKIEYYVKLQVHQKEKKGNSNNNNNINNNNNKSNSTVEKEVKVSFNDGNNVSFVNNKNSKDNNKKITQQVKIANDKKKELDLPFLKLPPGITVTKIDGSLSNKNQKPSEKEYDSSRINVPGNNKSGVIVVETEKLIQTTTGNKDTEINRKNKKKKNKKQNVTNSNPVNSQPMVTLKNPVFHSLSETVSKEPSLPYDIAGASFGQAYISKSENGMVTIRSSRLQQSFNNSVPSHHNLLSDLKPVISEDAGTSFLNNSSSTESTISSFNAQEILSGLPGIEITKVDKKNLKHDDAKDCQCAQVSIISTNGEKCNLDKDDWVYDNIFTPKDVLEDELDAEERELEAFKRFCQQSIPPKQKEKVAHLNVKDIVLKKKNDVN